LGAEILLIFTIQAFITRKLLAKDILLLRSPMEHLIFSCLSICLPTQIYFHQNSPLILARCWQVISLPLCIINQDISPMINFQLASAFKK
jgi:hypothetical protein